MSSEKDLELAILTKGNEIRTLKQAKDAGNDQSAIQQLVVELLELKKQYKEVTGKEFASAPPSKKSASSKPKSSDVSESDKVSKTKAKREKKRALKNEKAEAKQAQGNAKIAEGLECTKVPSEADLLLRQAKFCAQMEQLEGTGEYSGQTVTPWDVEAENGVDYEKLIEQFGCQKLDTELVERFERVTGHIPHRYLRRGYFFAHRDLHLLLDAYEKGEQFFLYTGRGPSSGSLHLGHLIPFTFVAWLQKVFQVPLVIQLTDDEKFLFRDQTLEQSREMMYENAKDIIACGFDVKKTFIFGNTDYIQHLYPIVLKVQKCVTYNQVRGIFGFTGSDNIGKSAFPAVQAVPSFSETFPIPFQGGKQMRCLIPSAIDQDPYFRMTRDVANRLGYLKPSTMYSKFFPALQGSSTKMSASKATTTIYISDSPEEIANKVKKYAFSGGGETKEDHIKYGANLQVDIPFQYLSFMLEDDAELAHIAEEYGSGRMMSGEVKAKLIHTLSTFTQEMQKIRASITDEQIQEFMRVRPLAF